MSGRLHPERLSVMPSPWEVMLTRSGHAQWACTSVLEQNKGDLLCTPPANLHCAAAGHPHAAGAGGLGGRRASLTVKAPSQGPRIRSGPRSTQPATQLQLSRPLGSPSRRCVCLRPSVGHWERHVPCCASFEGQYERRRMFGSACRLTAASLQVQVLESPLLGGSGDKALEPGKAGAPGEPHHGRALVTEGSGSSTPRRLGSTLAHLLFSG